MLVHYFIVLYIVNWSRRKNMKKGKEREKKKMVSFSTAIGKTTENKISDYKIGGNNTAVIRQHLL